MGGGEGERKDLLGNLETFPPVPHAVSNRVCHDLPGLVTTHAGLEEAVLLDVEGPVGARRALHDVVLFYVVGP